MTLYEDIGVYAIYNKVTGKFYIGSSGTLKERLDGHRSKLRSGKHPIKYLQSSFNKRGEKDFLFKIIKRCPEDVMLEWEQYYINALDPEYNTCKIAGSTSGYKLSQEAKDKISKSKLGKPRPPEVLEKLRQANIGRKFSEERRREMSIVRKGKLKSTATKLNMSKKIVQLDKITGETVNEFSSIGDACKSYGVDRGTLRQYLYNRNKRETEFIWKFKNNI